MYKDRKPIERIKGKYINTPEVREIDDFALETANALCDRFPNIDILDLENLFNRYFRFYVSRRLGIESIEEES